MLNIHPRTYNDALRLYRCLEVRKYAPALTDEIVEDMYRFLSGNPKNTIGLSNGTIYYPEAGGEKTEAHTVETVTGFDHLVFSTTFFSVVNTASDNSGCGGCGCSSNNNNNNNNNNNG